MPKPRRSTKRTTGLRTLLVLTLAAGLTLAVGTRPAAAAAPCWKAVLSDWFADGRIDQTYPLSCYRDAQKHLPPDAEAYSGAGADIQRALLAAIRVDKGTGGGGGSASNGGGGGSTPSSGGPLRQPSDPRASASAEGKHKGLVTRWFDAVGPANAESIPLPLLVLGGIAILLLLTAAASFIFRRLNARKPSSSPPEPEQL